MNMLERLLPSEVARLVLGYLKTEGCNNAFKAFLTECPHLKEYAMLLERGREYTTKVNGRTLEECLDEFADLKKAVSTKTSVSQHYVNADGQVRHLVLDTPAEGDKNVAPGSAFIVNDASPGSYAKNEVPNPCVPDKNVALGSAFIINDASPGPYAKNEVPNPCVPKKTINIETKTKRSRSKRASKQTTSVLEDAWKAVSLSGKSGADSRLSSNNNTALAAGESSSVETSVKTTYCESRTLPKSKGLVPKNLFDTNEDDSCKQCTKNQTGRTVRSSRRSKNDSALGSKQTWQSSMVASASSTNRETVPRVRLKMANAYQAAVVISEEDENIGMETDYDVPELDVEPIENDEGRGSCNNQEAGGGTGMGEENDNCDIRETVSPKPSTSGELPKRQETPVQIMEPLALEIQEVSEESPGLHTPLKNVDVHSMMSTPSKFNDAASVISVGRSPKRKSHTPKRRFNKPPVSRPAATPSFMNDESLYSFPFPVDDPVSVDMSSIVKNLLENTQLQEKLAENINQVVASHHPSNSNTTQVAPEPCGEETVQCQQSLENFLETKESFVNEHVNEETIGGIVELTKDDPAFDALFSLFNVEKEAFLENQRKQQMTGAPAENLCDVNGNLKAPTPEAAGKDLSSDDTILDQLHAMVSLEDNATVPPSQQGTNRQCFDTTTEGCDAEVVYVLNLPTPQSEIVVQSNVGEIVYNEVDQPDNVVMDSVNIASASGCVDKREADFPVQGHPKSRSSETHDLNISSIANSSDENVRHFSRELMDLKSPYISHTNSPAPIDIETACQSQVMAKEVYRDGTEAFPHKTVSYSTPAHNQLNTSMEFTAGPGNEDNRVPETRSLNKVPEISPRNLGAGDGASQDSGIQWKLEVLEMRPVPANVECIQFSSVSFESDQSKNAGEVHCSTKDVSFTKPQTVGHNSAKPRRVPLTTLSNVPSPATPADAGHFGSSSIPSPFLPGPFSPQTPMMPHTPSHGMQSPSQSPRETSAPFSSLSSHCASPRTTAPARPFVTSPAPEMIALSPAPSVYARRTDSRAAKPCPSPVPRSQSQPRGSSSSVPSPFMCHPVSPRTPGMVPPVSPMMKESLSHEQVHSPFNPVTTDPAEQKHSQSSSSVEVTSTDQGEILSMTAEFSPSQPLSTSSPSPPVRTKKAVTSIVPFVVKKTPDKAVAVIKLVDSEASPNLSQTAQHVMTSRMTPDKLAAASNQLLQMQSVTPDKQVHSTPGKEQTLDTYRTPNKGPPSVGSCRSTQSPYNALRMTPVQITDEDYSQHQNLAVASIMLTPQKGSKHSSDNDEDISNESDETCISVATVVREEERQAVDAILQPSPAKSTCATPQKLFYRNRDTPVKSNSPSPNSSPQNFTQIVSKAPPVVFKKPNISKDCPSPVKSNDNENPPPKKVIDSEGVQSCEVQNFTESGQDVSYPTKNNSVLHSKGKGSEGGLLKRQTETSSGLVVESENFGNELNHSSSTGLPSDGDAPMSDHQHSVMMESLSSETISAFQAYAESIPGVERTTVSGETMQINITTNFGLPPSQSVSCPTASAQVATSASQEMSSCFTQQELDDERDLLAEVHSTLASMPPLSNDQLDDSTTPGTCSQNKDIPLLTGALMGFSAAQEQIYPTPVSEPNKVFVHSPPYQQRGSKSKKKSHSRRSSVSEIGTPPAPSYQMPIPTSVNLLDPGVRVIQVKTQKGNIIPIFLTPLDSFDQSTLGEQQVSPSHASPMKVIPVEVKDIKSPEARMLLEDNSQSFDTVFGNKDTSEKSSFIENLLSSQKDDTTSNEAVKADSKKVPVSETASQALRNPSVAQVSESGSSVNTSPDMDQVKGSRLHQERTATEGVIELSKMETRRKRKKKSCKSEPKAKQRRTKSVPVDDCDNVELLDFLQAHPVGDLCRKTMPPPSPHLSVSGSPVKTPAKVESYKFCSPAPVGDQTQDGHSSMWHDIVHIDLGEQTKIMADITRPLSELLKTPTKAGTHHAHGNPLRSPHAVTDLLKTPTKPEVHRPHGTPRSQHAGTPGRLNSASNSSVNFSPMRGKLRPILESCSIIDNHVVASPSMSLDRDSEVDPDEFLQRLPEQVRNVAKATKLNKQSEPSSTSKFPSLSAANIVTVESTSQVPANITCTSPLEIAAAESGIFPSESTGNQQNVSNSQVSCSGVLTPSVEIAPVNAPAVRQSFSVQSAPVNVPVSSSMCFMNLPPIQPRVQPTPPVQPSVILVQLPNGQYAAVLSTPALAPAAPAVVTSTATTTEHKKRKYTRKKKAPSSKKTTTPAVPLQNTTLPPMNPVFQAPQILNFSQPGPSIPQFLVSLPQQTVQPTTQPAPVVIQQVSSNLPATCSTPPVTVSQPVTLSQPVTVSQPVPGVAKPGAVNEPSQSMMSPTELVIAETPPYMPELEKEEIIRKISPGLDALIRMASPKNDPNEQPKSPRPTKASTDHLCSSSHRRPGKTVPRTSEISPGKRTGFAKWSSFSLLVSAAIEYQEMRKKERQTPAKDVPRVDADVSIDMPSEDIFLGLESEGQSPVKKPVETSENTLKQSTSGSVSAESSVKLAGAKSKTVPKKTRKSKEESRKKSKVSKPEFTSLVLPPESVISNMQGSENEVVISIPNNAQPTIDTEMFSALLNDGSDVDNGKLGGRAAKRGKRKQKRRSSSKKSEGKQTSSVEMTALQTVPGEGLETVPLLLGKDNMLKSDDLTELPRSKTKKGRSQPTKKQLPKVSATLHKKSLPSAKDATVTQENSQQIKTQASAAQAPKDSLYFTSQIDENRGNSLNKPQEPPKTVGAMLKILRDEKAKANPHVRVLQFNEFESEATTASMSKSTKEPIQPKTQANQDLGDVVQEKATLVSRETLQSEINDVEMADNSSACSPTEFSDPKLNARVDIHVSRLSNDKDGCNAPVSDENNFDSDDLGPLPIPRRRSSKAEKSETRTLNVQTVAEVAQMDEVEEVSSSVNYSSPQSRLVTKSDKHSRLRLKESSSKDKITGTSSSKTKDIVTPSSSKTENKVSSKPKDKVTASSSKTKDIVTASSSKTKDIVTVSSSKTEDKVSSNPKDKVTASGSKTKDIVTASSSKTKDIVTVSSSKTEDKVSSKPKDKVTASSSKTNDIVTASSSKTKDIVTASMSKTKDIVTASSSKTNDIVTASSSKTKDIVTVSRSKTKDKVRSKPKDKVTASSSKANDIVTASSSKTKDIVTASSSKTKDIVTASSSKTKDIVTVSSSKTDDIVTVSSSKTVDKVSSKPKDKVDASNSDTKDNVTAGSSNSKKRIGGSSSKVLGLSSKSSKTMKAKKSKKKPVVQLDRKMLDAICKAAGLDLGKFMPDSSDSSDQDDDEEIGHVAEDDATCTAETDSENENEKNGDEKSNFLFDLKTLTEKDVKSRACVEKTRLHREEQDGGHACDNESMVGNSFSSVISTCTSPDIVSSQKRQTSSSKVGSIKELKGWTTPDSNDVISSQKLKTLSLGAKCQVVGEKSPGVKKRSLKSDNARTRVKKSEQKMGDEGQTSAKKSVHKVHIVASGTKSVEAGHSDSAGGHIPGQGATKVRSKDSDSLRGVRSPKKTKMQLSSLDDVFASVIMTSPENPTQKKVEGSVYRIPSDVVTKFRQKTSSSKSSKSLKSNTKRPEKNVPSAPSNNIFKSDSIYSSGDSSKMSVPVVSESSQIISEKSKNVITTSTSQPSDATSEKEMHTSCSEVHGLESDPKHVGYSNKVADISKIVKHVGKTKPSPRSQIQMDLEEIFGNESPPKNLQKVGKSVPSSSDSQGQPAARKSPRKRTVTSVTVTPKKRQPKKSPKKKDNKTSRLVSSSKSKPKKDLMKVKVPNREVVTNNVLTEDSSSIPPDDNTPKVYSPQLTPQKYFPMDISPDQSPERLIKSEVDSDDDMEINAAETLVSMATVNVDNLDLFPEYLPDLGILSNASSQPVFPTSTQTLVTSDDSRTGLVFKTPEKPQMTESETTRRTPRKGTPRKLLVMNQDPLSDLKKKDRDLFERMVSKSPDKFVKAKKSKKPSVKRLSPRKHSKGKRHQ